MDSPNLPPPVPDAPAEVAPPRFHRGGTVLALLVIAGCSVLAVMGNEKEKSQAKQDIDTVRPNVLLEMMARYSYGAKVQMKTFGQWNDQNEAQLEEALGNMSKGPADRFRQSIVKAALKGEPVDQDEVAGAIKEAPVLERDWEILQQVQESGRTTPEKDWQEFEQRHGWIARLARIPGLPETDPERAALAADGTKTMIVWLLAFFGGLLAFGAGIGIVIWMIIWLVGGKLKSAVVRPASAWGGVLLEGFAIYLFGLTVIPDLLHHFAPAMPRWGMPAVAAFVVLVAVLWPLWRGMKGRAWSHNVGLHRGQGFWKEAGCGLLGWLAAIPFVVLTLLAAQWLASRMETEISHPIIEPLMRPGPMQWILAGLAVVWAPLSEELTFRGMLFPGLSAMMRWLLGGVVGAFIFAAIHPQGWLAVPALMSIALAATALRVMRGSLIAPMTLHAINNGVIVLLLIMLTAS